MLMQMITLLSDLGTKGTSVSVTKAILLKHLPEAAIVDITHQVKPFDLQKAAYILRTAYRHFPQRTVHLVLVDVFSDTGNDMLLAERDGHYFIVPDNGIIQMIFEEQCSETFLCTGNIKLASLAVWTDQAGAVIKKISSIPDQIYSFPHFISNKGYRPISPKVMNNIIECPIIYIDHFSNVVLGIAIQQFTSVLGNSSFSIKIPRNKDLTVISENYHDVKDGLPLCRFNDAGYLEIAVNHGSAASLLGLGTLTERELHYQIVRIFIEEK